MKIAPSHRLISAVVLSLFFLIFQFMTLFLLPREYGSVYGYAGGEFEIAEEMTFISDGTTSGFYGLNLGDTCIVTVRRHPFDGSKNRVSYNDFENTWDEVDNYNVQDNTGDPLLSAGLVEGIIYGGTD